MASGLVVGRSVEPIFVGLAAVGLALIKVGGSDSGRLNGEEVDGADDTGESDTTLAGGVGADDGESDTTVAGGVGADDGESDTRIVVIS